MTLCPRGGLWSSARPFPTGCPPELTPLLGLYRAAVALSLGQLHSCELKILAWGTPSLALSSPDASQRPSTTSCCNHHAQLPLSTCPFPARELWTDNDQRPSFLQGQ